jgi:hypothetical protein
LGNEYVGKEKKDEKPSEVNQVSSHIPSLNLSPCGFIVTIVGEMVTRASFASKGSVRREW